MSVDTHELRIALTVDDLDQAVAFYGKVLGRELAAQWDQPRGKGGVFVVAKATLEILHAEMAGGVDDFEVGHRVSGLGASRSRRRRYGRHDGCGHECRRSSARWPEAGSLG